MMCAISGARHRVKRVTQSSKEILWLWYARGRMRKERCSKSADFDDIVKRIELEAWNM